MHNAKMIFAALICGAAISTAYSAKNRPENSKKPKQELKKKKKTPTPEYYQVKIKYPYFYAAQSSAFSLSVK